MHETMFDDTIVEHDIFTDFECPVSRISKLGQQQPAQALSSFIPTESF
jgi:hypothetical protein